MSRRHKSSQAHCHISFNFIRFIKWQIGSYLYHIHMMIDDDPAVDLLNILFVLLTITVIMLRSIGPACDE
jgi:hypothetical protein